MSYLIPEYLAYLEPRASASTIDIRGIVLNRVHEDLPFGLAYATTEQLDAWINRAKLGRWTRRTYRNHIRAFYRWATQHRHLDGDPSLELPNIRPPRLIPRRATEEEVAVALTAPEPLRTAAILASFAGERAFEIARQRREDITEKLVFIPDGKGGEPGVVPTHPFVWEAFRERPSGLLVLHEGREVTGQWLSALARRTFTRMGIPNVRLHRLRHRFGTVIQEMYGDIRVTQECLRHKAVTSTQGYTYVAGERKAAAISALPVPGAPEPVSSRLGDTTGNPA